MRINRYVDISTIDREAKKDYIDRHSPFIHCEPKAKAGEKFKVKVKVGRRVSSSRRFRPLHCLGSALEW